MIPGFHEVTLVIVVDLAEELRHQLRALGTRSHERHVTGEDIEELRQLVDAELAKEAADARRAWIILLSPNRARVLFGVDGHRAELHHFEGRPVLADTNLSIEDRAGRGELHERSDDGHQRPRENEEQDCRKLLERIPFRSQRHVVIRSWER